jgi:serine/threonine protein kinase
MPPHIPFNELEFKDCIGVGGFGKVYRGYWRRHELVAIKEARIEGSGSSASSGVNEHFLDKIQQKVLQEAKLFWMLRHPNIIQLKGICFQKPHYCLVMEYAKGGSLGRLLCVRKLGFPPYILIKWALHAMRDLQSPFDKNIRWET